MDLREFNREISGAIELEKADFISKFASSETSKNTDKGSLDGVFERYKNAGLVPTNIVQLFEREGHFSVVYTKYCMIIFYIKLTRDALEWEWDYQKYPETGQPNDLNVPGCTLFVDYVHSNNIGTLAEKRSVIKCIDFLVSLCEERGVDRIEGGGLSVDGASLLWSLVRRMFR